MVGRSRRLGRRVVAAGAVALAGLAVAAGPALAGPAPGSQVPAPTPARVLLAWSFNPLVTVGLLGAAICGPPAPRACGWSRAGTRRRLPRVLHSPPMRVIGHPLVAWVLFTMSLYALY